MTEQTGRIVELKRVTLDMCSACLGGQGGECHTPGCAFWMSTAPDVPIRPIEQSDHSEPACCEPYPDSPTSNYYD